MSHALAAAAEPHMLELHQLIRQLDPAALRRDVESHVRAQVQRVADAISELLQLPADDDLGTHLQRMRDALHALPAGDLPARSARRAWRRYRTELMKSYDAFGRSLEAWDVHVPRLRPTNYLRNVVHVGNGLLAALILMWVPHRPTLLMLLAPIVLWAWGSELLRRFSPGYNRLLMKGLGPIAHPHEYHRVNSASWYTLALFILAAADIPAAAAVALLTLSLGDPAAALIGRRWGRHRLANGRSLEGFAAFVLAGTLGSFAILQVGWPGVHIGLAAATAVAGATAGAIAELLSRRVDDNLTVPLAAFAAAVGVLGVAVA